MFTQLPPSSVHQSSLRWKHTFTQGPRGLLLTQLLLTQARYSLMWSFKETVMPNAESPMGQISRPVPFTPLLLKGVTPCDPPVFWVETLSVTELPLAVDALGLHRQLKPQVLLNRSPADCPKLCVPVWTHFIQKALFFPPRYIDIAFWDCASQVYSGMHFLDMKINGLLSLAFLMTWLNWSDSKKASSLLWCYL